ncbi:MAG TPA: thiamine pyrophosphate-dependent enzyme, partial [Ignavibacteria bacterium]|nr:thiamine pyrophosphate-dependent enzyme [Ignavibacteria bacterium]
MEPQLPLKEQESKNWEHFLSIPEFDRTVVNTGLVKSSQLFQPLFEFSGACTGCGETPYVKLVSQLYGDRAVIANATGCSSIYGGNLPTTPWTKNSDGRGPAWSNSLFEDNAEFGLGMRISADKHNEYAGELLLRLRENIGDNLVNEILNADQSDEPGIYEQRKRVEELNNKLKVMNTPDAEELLSIADYLVKRSVWIIGGDGWAYDIGFGGLDHVIASGKNVNILVLDTEVYSNTGGQMSKATGLGAVAKFATSGKLTPKKDLAMMAINYGSVYVAKVAMGANDTHTLRAFLEAESYDGPSLIIAYSHCIAHGINMEKAIDHQKNAVKSGYWPLFRYDPRLIDENKNPFRLDSGEPVIKLEEYAYAQARYKMLTKSDPLQAKKLMKLAQEDVKKRFDIYKRLAESKPNSEPETKSNSESKESNSITN